MKLIAFLLVILQVLCVYGRSGRDCEHNLENCTDMVKPFLNDLRYMFPTTVQDVDDMCKMWSRFVDCVRRYVTDCATDDQRSKFNNAVGDSIDTVHAICSSERYQREYLQNASCFRKVSVDSCGTYYSAMVEQVTNPHSDNEHICCSYSQFKSCVSGPLLRLCGSRARTIMDHSMAFLITRCGKTYYSLSYQCPRARTAPEPTFTTKTTTTTLRPPAAFAETTWQPRTVIYTVPPEPSRRVSNYDSYANKPTVSTLGLIFLAMLTRIFNRQT